MTQSADTESIVVVCFDSDKPPVETVQRILRELDVPSGLNPRSRWHESGLLQVRTTREVSDEFFDRLRELPGVLRVAATSGQHSIAASRDGAESTVALSDTVHIGGGELTIVAGPCAVEDKTQICEIAAAVKEAGAKALRGGAFKPRTSPYSFGGLGEKGLEYLSLAREQTGLPIVTEALDFSHVDVVAEHADMIQIGARNMQNFPLLFKAGSHPSGKPVLLKRGFAASIEEFLHAAEYILVGRLFSGCEEPGVVLCERGIRTFDSACRFTLDVGAIPVLQERTHLPVVADPSHAAGTRERVAPLARASIAAGAAGLLVEVHTNPEDSWVDGDHTLDPKRFAELVDEVHRITPNGDWRKRQ